MTKKMELFLEDPVKFVQGLSPLVVILSSLGIIVTIVLFVLFYRNRKEDVLMLWSPNLESRLMVAPDAMGKLIFK